jgi:hypothetical protein
MRVKKRAASASYPCESDSGQFSWQATALHVTASVAMTLLDTGGASDATDISDYRTLYEEQRCKNQVIHIYVQSRLIQSNINVSGYH